jgi:Tol biopolymer transport system component
VEHGRQGLRLAAGQRIGTYLIVRPLGEGGMGEVWLARDTSIGRDVAIKIVAARFAGDSDRVRRFEQEAQAAGQINHPNILTVHAVGREAGAPYLVSEFLEGETLAARLRSGALPPDRAIDLAVQIADGLAAAHDHGIVHRDLKPDNLFLTTTGRVKILDFGVAKLIAAARGDDDPTLAQTTAGAVIGTAGYMAPEQVRGQAVDHRADIFAFGAVLYEMVSGRRAFTGGSSVEDLHAILTSDPPPPDGAPPAVNRVIRHALEKAPDSRFQSARDLAFHLRALQDDAAAAMPGAIFHGVRRAGRGSMRAALLWTAGVIGLGGAAAWLALSGPGAHRAVAAPERRFSIATGPAPLYAFERPPLALAPDGRRMAYVAGREGDARIFVRDLDSLSPRPIPGTENGFGPFFSPDGEQLGFFVSDSVMRVDVGGGPPTRLAAATPVSRGGTWSPDGFIYFTPSQSSSVVRVKASGGEIEPVTERDAATDEEGHVWPDVSHDGTVLVYAERRGTSFADARVVLRSITTGETRILAESGTCPRFAPDGSVIFARGKTLFAVSTNPTTLAAIGSPRPVLDGVQMDPLVGYAIYAAARDGTIVYVPGDARPAGRTLLWVSGTGSESPAFPEERPFLYPAVSPDGRSVAVTIESMQQDLWRFEVGQPVLTRLTSSAGEDFGAVWSPDGSRLAFTSVREGDRPAVFVKPAGRPDGESRLTSTRVLFPNAWTADGASLVITEEDQSTGRELIRLLSTTVDRLDLQPIAPSPFGRYGAALSTDGSRVAFVSLETGRAEVFVSSWPDTRNAKQASIGGGTSPVWARNGRTLFYRSGDGVFAVDVGASPLVSRSPPRVLFRGRFEEPARPDWPRNYDVAPDGRFLMIRQTYTPVLRDVVVILNWKETTPAAVRNP